MVTVKEKRGELGGDDSTRRRKEVGRDERGGVDGGPERTNEGFESTRMEKLRREREGSELTSCRTQHCEDKSRRSEGVKDEVSFVSPVSFSRTTRLTEVHQ